MTYLSYDDKMDLLSSMFQKKIQRLQSLPEDVAREEAYRELVELGYIGEDGNLAEPYVALREQHV